MKRKNLITLGRILKAHGVHGAVKAAYFGQAPDNILRADRLWLIPKSAPSRSEPCPEPFEGHKTKIIPGGLIIKLPGYDTREAAETLSGADLCVDRKDLPEPEEGEYYQADLLNLEAFTTSGRLLGRVEKILEQGESLVLVITNEEKVEIMVPFSEDSVPEVDLRAGKLVISELPGLLDL